MLLANAPVIDGRGTPVRYQGPRAPYGVKDGVFEGSMLFFNRLARLIIYGGFPHNHFLLEGYLRVFLKAQYLGDCECMRIFAHFYITYRCIQHDKHEFTR
jgi:hypothetical protein